MGKKIEGVGSKTKSYFWVNAFIREFIATLVSERKAHFIAAIILALVSFAVVMMTYVSNVILS